MSFFRALLAALAAPILLWSCSAMPDHDPNAPARPAIGERQTLQTAEGAQLVWYELSAPGTERPPLILFPSAGREASDFNELARRLNDEGYTVWLVQPAAIDGARASKDAPSLMDLASDASHLVGRAGGKPVLVGHAFGNRLARATATLTAKDISGVVLLAAGGLKPIPEKARQALTNSFRPDLSPAEHEAAVHYGFFADTSDVPDYWLRGWHVKTGTMQGQAVARTEASEWWAAGGAPLLVIAGLQDSIAPPVDTIDLLEAEFAGRVSGVRIDGAGHALLPEKPEEVARAMLDWLDEH